MANTFIPVRINYSGNTPVGFAEYQAGESIVHYGGVLLIGAGRRIQGDFSSANPTAFQDSAANTRTLVYAMPNGTATESGYVVRNSSDPANSNIGLLRCNATAVSLESNVSGPGSQLPLDFYTAGSLRLRLAATGGVQASTPIRLPAYTLATLPSAAAFVAHTIEVSDAAGGAKTCRSNGSAWQILNTTTTVS